MCRNSGCRWSRAWSATAWKPHARCWPKPASRCTPISMPRWPRCACIWEAANDLATHHPRYKVILQGISGRAGRLHSRLMREYGTNIVAGVAPQKNINEINEIPIFPDCASAVAATGATVSVALVGACDLLEAMQEAVAAGIKMIVTPT